MHISITGGRVIDPAQDIDEILDIHIGARRIITLGEAPAGFDPAQIIDASNHYVCPGLVDMSARLREPGLEHKATIASETSAAVAGGITTLCCPPDTDPVIDTPAVVELISQRAEQAGMSRVVCLGALTQELAGDRLAEMGALKNAGCVGVSNAYHPITSTEVLRRALEYASTFNLTVTLYPEDPWLSHGGCAHEGRVSTRLGLAPIPETAETVEIARDLLLIEQTGVAAHFARISSGRAVTMIAEARGRGLPVTADVAAHQLHLVDSDIMGYNALCHVRPPLRTKTDREALRSGLAGGVISAVCSDHQPHEPDVKNAPFAATEPGISALETLLPLTLKLVDDNTLQLHDAIASLTYRPAQILGLAAGTLTVGAIADICIIDPDHTWTLDETTMTSVGHNTPFLGQRFKGRVSRTLVSGRLVYDNK